MRSGVSRISRIYLETEEWSISHIQDILYYVPPRKSKVGELNLERETTCSLGLLPAMKSLKINKKVNKKYGQILQANLSRLDLYPFLPLGIMFLLKLNSLNLKIFLNLLLKPFLLINYRGSLVKDYCVLVV